MIHLIHKGNERFHRFLTLALAHARAHTHTHTHLLAGILPPVPIGDPPGPTHMSRAPHGAYSRQRSCHALHPQNRRRWGLQTQTCCRHTAICSSFQPTRLVLTVISSQTGAETVNRLRVIAAAPRPQATGTRQCVSRLSPHLPTPDNTDRPWLV